MKVRMGSSAWEHWEELELVCMAQRGDLRAFDALVARYRPGATVLARQVLRAQESAEDAVQDSFLVAFKALPQLEDPERFAGWFGAIVRNRARKLVAGFRPIHVPIDDVILSHSPSLSEELELHWEAESVRSAIVKVPSDCRSILELYYLEEWAVKQIGDFLGLPVTTVKWRLHAGRKALRAALAQDLEETHESGK